MRWLGSSSGWIRTSHNGIRPALRAPCAFLDNARAAWDGAFQREELALGATVVAEVDDMGASSRQPCGIC